MEMNLNFGDDEGDDPRGRKRQTQSCDRCKSKKRRCDGFNPCANCVKANAECTMNIAQKKRGPKKFSNISANSSAESGGDSGEQLVKKQRMTETKSVNLAADHDININININGTETGSLGPLIPVAPQSDLGVVSTATPNQPLEFESLFDDAFPTLHQNSILEFDLDFAMNFDTFDLKNNIPFLNLDLPAGQIPMKHNSFNPPELVNNCQQQINNGPLSIDPEVLALYTQLNPKMSVQNNLDMLLSSTLQAQKPYNFNNNSTELTNPELIGIPTTFYIHLISMFFTYYHPSFPILDENSFLEKLVPINSIHPMLLNAVYAIGCFYSRSPYLYQNPFYTPQKAVEYFIAKALAVAPPPEEWTDISSKSSAICQASLLLTSIDLPAKQSHTRMMVGMSIRLNQQFQMFSERETHNFMTLVNGVKKFYVDCTILERKKLWWGTLFADLGLSLSAGTPLLINEVDYADTFSFLSSGSSSPSVSLEVETNQIVNQKSNNVLSHDSAGKWMPYFSGFPKDTIFGADVNSELWGRQSLGFFQIGHLFSNMDTFAQVVQLSFFTRRALRLSLATTRFSYTSAFSSLGSALINSILTDNGDELQRIHDSLLVFYENLPSTLRLWVSLQVFVSDNIQDLNTYSTFTETQPLGSVAVLLNLLFFATLTLLHQKNGASPTTKFAVTSSNMSHLNAKFSSNDMIRIAYRAQVHILCKIYGNSCPPQPTTIPPSSLVGFPIICTLLCMPATALLHSQPSSSSLTTKLLQPYTPNAFIPVAEQVDASGIDSLASVLLPVLENMGQVWPLACTHYETLRNTMDVLRLKQASETLLGISNPITSTGIHSSHSYVPYLPNMAVPPESGIAHDAATVDVCGDEEVGGDVELPSVGGGGTEKSWYELREEFESEFLL